MVFVERYVIQRPEENIIWWVACQPLGSIQSRVYYTATDAVGGLVVTDEGRNDGQ
jgi:hypothetical protein